MFPLISIAFAGPLPKETSQIVLVTVRDEESSQGTLRRAVLGPRGWRWEGEPVPARVGAAGVAWGVGLHPPQPGLQKREGDLRSPAGIFLLGDAFRDDSVPEMSVAWPLRWVGPRDLWVEDPSSPHYNEHIVVPGTRPLLPWEEAARMRLFEPVLALKIFIEHNPTPAVPYAGSAVFLHGPVDGDAATAGCTAIARRDLEEILRFLSPEARPVLVLLTEADLSRLAPLWALPVP